MEDELETRTFQVTFTAVVDAHDRSTAVDEARQMIRDDRRFEADDVREIEL